MTEKEYYKSELKQTGGLLSRAENFWYHYKWHSLIALFLIFTILVCSLQMCEKEEYDINIIYAGSRVIDRKSNGNDVSEYVTFLSSMKRVCADFDGNGEIGVTLSNLFVLSKEQISEIEKESGYEVNYTLMENDKQVLIDRMSYSDYYVCFVSVGVYEEYCRMADGTSLFTPLSPYLPEGDHGLELYADNAVYLRSSTFHDLPAISNLPDDTLICLRMKSAVGGRFDKGSTEEHFARSEQVIRNILAYKSK